MIIQYHLENKTKQCIKCREQNVLFLTNMIQPNAFYFVMFSDRDIFETLHLNYVVGLLLDKIIYKPLLMILDWSITSLHMMKWLGIDAEIKLSMDEEAIVVASLHKYNSDLHFGLIRMWV